MKQAFRLIGYPWRGVCFRHGIPIVFLYAILLPYLMRMLALEDVEMAARQTFRISQLVLAAATLWPLFCFFLPVYQPGVRETLAALRHPVASCAGALLLLAQASYLPLYLWLFASLPGYRMIVWVLLFQSFCLSVVFTFLLPLLRSPVINMMGDCSIYVSPSRL